MPGLVADLTPKGPGGKITAAELKDLDFSGRALLLCAGWSAYWGTPEYDRHPFPTREVARVLVEGRVGLLGIDTLVADDTKDPTRPVHSMLLGAGIPIVENLTNLESLTSKNFVFFAVPPKVARAASFPVRAFALTTD